MVRYNVEHNFTNNCNDTRAEKYSTVLYCTVLVASCNQLLVKTALIIAAYYKAYIYDKFYECCIYNVRVVLRLITVVQFHNTRTIHLQIADCDEYTLPGPMEGSFGNYKSDRKPPGF